MRQTGCAFGAQPSPPQGERMHPEIDALQEHVRTGRGTWAEGSCEPEGFFVNGARVVVYLFAWVRLHGATD